MMKLKKPSKRPPIYAAKTVVTKALKLLTLEQRVQVIAAALRSMGLPTFAGALTEALEETNREQHRDF